MKKSNIAKNMSKLLYNRWLLYIILFASIINMTVYALMGDITTPVIFVLVGTITSFFNKNMLVILVISLAFSNILKYGTSKMIVAEGFEGTEGGEGEINKELTTEGTTGGEDKPAKATVTKKMITKTPDLDDTQESYENLFTLQKQIQESMDSLTANLQQAELAVENIHKKMNK